MTTDELNNRARVYLNRVGNDYNAAHSLLRGMSEEEWDKFFAYIGRTIPDFDAAVELTVEWRLLLSLTPAQLCEAWLRATESRSK